MGMCLALTMLRDEHFARILEDPPLIWLAIAPDDPELYAQARTPPKPSLFARLRGRTPASPPMPAPLALVAPDGEATDLDKAWHAIHYLLTGNASGGELPAGFLLAGGTHLDTIEAGYGPPRLLSASDTRAVQAALAAVTEADLMRRWDPAQMMELEIYPEIWDRDGSDDDPRGYVLEYFEGLRRFVTRAAEAEMGLVITLV